MVLRDYLQLLMLAVLRLKAKSAACHMFLDSAAPTMISVVTRIQPSYVCQLCIQGTREAYLEAKCLARLTLTFNKLPKKANSGRLIYGTSKLRVVVNCRSARSLQCLASWFPC